MPLGPTHPPLLNRCQGYFLWVKAAGAYFDHSPPSSPEEIMKDSIVVFPCGFMTRTGPSLAHHELKADAPHKITFLLSVL